MNPTFVSGDIFLSQAQTLGFGLSANGQWDVSPLHTTLLDRYPVFASDFRRRGRTGQLAPGTVWIWRESNPWLMAWIVRETPQGAARLRHIDTALLYLYHNWQREGLQSLAIAHFEDDAEWGQIRHLLIERLDHLALPVTIYEPRASAHHPAADPPQ